MGQQRGDKPRLSVDTFTQKFVMFSDTAGGFVGLIEIETRSAKALSPPIGDTHDATLGQMLSYLLAGTVAVDGSAESVTRGILGSRLAVRSTRWATGRRLTPRRADLCGLVEQLNAALAQLRQRIATSS